MKLIFAFGIILISLNGFTQPQITINNIGTYGDTVHCNFIDSTTNQGSSGTNITWNFSNVLTTGTFVKYVLNPSTTPNGSKFPAANLCERVIKLSSDIYQYYEVTNNYFDILGFDFAGLDSSKYEKIDTACFFPVSYPYSLNDSSIFHLWFYSGMGHIKTYTGRHITVDGYGTLILPNGTYNNVIRYRSVFYKLTETTIAGNTTIDTFFEEDFTWISEDYKGELLFINTQNLKNGLPSPGGLEAHYVQNPESVIPPSGLVTDFDGNTYNTVTIGTQTWLKENLKVTHYRNGTPIPNVTDNTSWSNLTTGAYCDYNNTVSNSNIYGRLYNWFAAANTNKICPNGWHVPSDAEWNILEKYLDNTVDTLATGWVGTDIGGKLKDTTLWNSPNTGATNVSGFSALPGLCRHNNGNYFLPNSANVTFWWTNTTHDSITSFDRFLSYDNCHINRYFLNKKSGYSLRCVKDDSVITQINFNNIDKYIQIYPNPAIDMVYINIDDENSTLSNINVKMQIFNVIGECVLLNVLKNNINKIDISSLKAGFYVVQINYIDKKIQHKLIKK